MVKMRKDEKANSLVKLYERGFPVGFSATNEVVKMFRVQHDNIAAVGR
jgi:hypothetical protein